MRLVRATVHRFKSISTEVTLDVEADVTAVLAANDHGKSNLLSALLHLNSWAVFKPESLTWGEKDQAHYPAIEAEFRLDPFEVSAINEFVKDFRRKQEEEAADESIEATETDSNSDGVTAGQERQLEELDPAQSGAFPELSSTLVTVRRQGVGSGLTVSLDIDAETEVLTELVKYVVKMMPHFRLIDPVRSFSDSVTYKEIEDEENHFMKGILYFADLDPNDLEIFELTNESMAKLMIGTATLNNRLKQDWTQGKDLDFVLISDSANKAILLRIVDPAVPGIHVRPSERSLGFTHFFTTKSILYSYQMDSDASSFVWLFDEPGVYLHPAGQFDLLRVLDTPGTKNQVIFSTHSIFMIDRSQPSRHRLLIKNESGTIVERKPYSSRWRVALNALGVNFSGTILFSDCVLLVEGDSDVTYIYTLLAAAARLPKESFNFEVSSLAVISSGDPQRADALLRVLWEGVVKPRVLILVDGDAGGKRRAAKLSKVAKERGVVIERLEDELVIEDLLPGGYELFVECIVSHLYMVGYLLKNEQTKDSIADLEAKLKSTIADAPTGAPLAKKLYAQVKDFIGEEVSKVSVANLFYEEVAKRPEVVAPPAALEMLTRLAIDLGLPPSTLDQSSILRPIE